MALVGFDDTLHQRVADHILGLEMGEADAGDVLQDLDHVLEAGAGAAGQVDLGDVAGDHRGGAEADPVRNIFICSTVVFWLSSRMMKLLFSVRPRM